MQIVTWNIYKDNKKLHKVVEGINTFGADVICLQEVPDEFAQRLKDLEGYNVFITDEFHSKMVILSRLEVVGMGDVSHEETFTTFEKVHKRYEKKYTQRLKSHFVDVIKEEVRYRVFNTHLPLRVPPKVRMHYLDTILGNFHEEAENILCGDFNPVGKFPFNMLWGWAHSYNLVDYLHHEPMMLRKKFKQLGMKNVFRFRCTHPVTRQQLDYILTPKTLKVKKKKVYSKRFASDHRPLMVEVAA